MPREELVRLLASVFDRAADQLRAEGHEEPWPQDLRARDIVRLLRDQSRMIALRIYSHEAR